MIIIKVLVDEMPSGCKRCNYCVAKMYCLLLEDRKTTVPDEPYKRRPDCPLVYDFSDKQINDLTARIAELEEKQRWRVVANGELPDNWKPVLTIDMSESVRVPVPAFYDPETSLWSTLFPYDLWVTHWMPLPESPNDTQTQTIVYGKESEG